VTVKKKGGKFLGAALGYTFGGPLGALLGAAIRVRGSTKMKAGPQGRRRRVRPMAVSDPGVHRGVRAGDSLRRNPHPFSHGCRQSGRRVTKEKVETIRRFFREQLGYGGPSVRAHLRLIIESFQKKVEPPACAQRSPFGLCMKRGST